MQEFAISSQVCPSSHLTFVAHSDEKPVIPRGLGYRGPSISAGAKHVARGHHRPTQSHLEVFSSAERPHTTSRGQGVPQISPLCRIWYLWGPWHGSPKDTKGDTSWNLLCNTVHILHLFKATSLSLPTHHWNTRERTPPCHVSLKTKMKEKSRGGNPAKHVISSSIHRAGVVRETDTQPSPAQPSKGRNLARTKQRREVFAGAVAVRAFSAPQIFSVEGKTFRTAATSNCKTKGAEKGSRESTPGFVESRRSVTASPKAQPQSLAATDVL